jgi:hypothetical protein
MGDALTDAGARVAVVGIEEGRALISSVAKGMSHEALDLCGRLPRGGGPAGLLSRYAVVFANDSGPLRLAVAVGAATVGICWAPNLINAGPVAREGGRGSGVGVIRCFYQASLISYVAASYRRSETSRGAHNTLSSASSFSVLLPVARTIFTTVVPGVVEGQAPRRVVPHAFPEGTLA